MTNPTLAPDEWTPMLQYRDFWDVPRMFVLKRDETWLLFDCRFDDEVETRGGLHRL